MASDTERSGGFVRVLVAIVAGLSLILGLAGAGTAARWYSLRTVGTQSGWVPVIGGDATSYASGPCSSRPCNFLLLGSDSRSGLSAEQQQEFGTNQDIGGTSRADTIMLVHTDPELQKAIVLSFPRDLWVDVPGHGMDKINSAFEGGVTGGGPELMAKTVSQLTGLSIDHYLYVDLNGFQEVVNTLGGVDMCIPAYNVNTPGWVEGPDANGNPTPMYVNEAGRIVDPYTGLNVEPGCHKLDGFQSLAYVRSRHLPCDAAAPDFARIGRQQQFMRSVINQMLQPAQLARAPGLVGPVLSSLRRDQQFLPGDLVNLVGQLRGLSTGAVEFRAVPGRPAMKSAQAVVVMDPAAKEIFSAIKDGKPISGVGTQLGYIAPSEANTTVAVLDAGNHDGATAVEDVVTKAGFDITPGIVQGKLPKGVTHPAIVYRPDQAAYADVVSKYFPDLKKVEVQDLRWPVAIVVAAGYRPTTGGAGGTGSGGSTGSGGTASQCPAPAA
jgi:anionic cell wall polymer biosynthesis LytR-Cps2A-Psr (LCP) family protein